MWRRVLLPTPSRIRGGHTLRKITMPVTIYTRSTCAPCKTVKYFLQKKGVAYAEKNIDDPEYAAEFARVSDYPMVPLVLVGETKIQGLNLGLLSQALML